MDQDRYINKNNIKKYYEYNMSQYSKYKIYKKKLKIFIILNNNIK